jgi:hypothetical protein
MFGSDAQDWSACGITPVLAVDFRRELIEHYSRGIATIERI